MSTQRVEVEGPLEFDYRSQRSGRVYHMVVVAGNYVTCSCPASGRCYHQREAREYLEREGIVVVPSASTVEDAFARFD